MKKFLKYLEKNAIKSHNKYDIIPARTKNLLSNSGLNYLIRISQNNKKPVFVIYDNREKVVSVFGNTSEATLIYSTYDNMKDYILDDENKDNIQIYKLEL